MRRREDSHTAFPPDPAPSSDLSEHIWLSVSPPSLPPSTGSRGLNYPPHTQLPSVPHCSHSLADCSNRLLCLLSHMMPLKPVTVICDSGTELIID